MIEDKHYSVEDVARESRVSTATVSRVLNKTGKVKQETAERVLDAVERLNYRPDRVARRMRVKATDSQIIGLIVTDIGNPFFSDLSRGVEDIAYEHKNAVLICNTDEDPQKEEFYIHSMQAEKVSGMIIAPATGNHEQLIRLADMDYPLVIIDRSLKEVNADSVTINNEMGAYLAVKKLIDLGHRRIGIINGIRGLSTTKERFAGYKKALKDNGIPLQKELVAYENFKESGGRKAVHDFMALAPPPTAIFSTNNLMTLGCIEGLHNHGKRIPEDVSLIGFDDMPWSVALNPPLTAVKQPGYELGVNAARLLIKRLSESNSRRTNIVLNPELIIRKSCGKPGK